MSNYDYESNSNSKKDPEIGERYAPVAKGYTKKKNEVTKGLKSILKLKDADEIKEYFIEDVLKPYSQTYLNELWKGLGRAIFGADTDYDIGINRKHSKSNTYTDYSRISRNEDAWESGVQANIQKMPKTVRFRSKYEAEEIIARMNEILYQRGYVRVLDFYDLCGIIADENDARYGWTKASFNSVYVKRLLNGEYAIDFGTRPVQLD